MADFDVEEVWIPEEDVWVADVCLEAGQAYIVRTSFTESDRSTLTIRHIKQVKTPKGGR